ncbi:MAG: hypothetical protein ACR2PL_21630 [Dehalococcoidia bacterium]
MTLDPTPRIIPSGRELENLIAAAAQSPVLFEKDGAVYRLSREDPNDDWSPYDPDQAIAALDETAGSWADLDIDDLIARLYRAREEGSRPSERP